MANDRKIKLEIAPYTAITIVGFMEDFEEDFKAQEKFASILEVLNDFRMHVYCAMKEEDLLDAKAHLEVQKLLGKTPPSK